LPSILVAAADTTAAVADTTVVADSTEGEAITAVMAAVFMGATPADSMAAIAAVMAIVEVTAGAADMAMAPTFLRSAC